VVEVRRALLAASQLRVEAPGFVGMSDGAITSQW
jgi:hypothetical protein